MSEADLQRLRNDLDTIHQAAGLELPFGWAEVRLCLALAPCGLVISLWSAFGPPDYDWLGVVPLVLLALAIAVWAFRNRAQFLGTPGRRRENRFGAISAASPPVLSLVSAERKRAITADRIRLSPTKWSCV